MNIRERLYKIIFEADTPAGKLFDVGLIISILVSVAVVMLDSIQEFSLAYGTILYGMEWFFTLLFTVEYLLRLWCIPRTLNYAKSFYGIIDLIAIIPTYFSLLLPGSQYLIVIRILRVLRIFRILKFVQYIGEANYLISALRESRRKIYLFFFSVVSIDIIFGTIMYLVEARADSGFTSIPKSIYWAIVTLTTVGYGDISPQTPLGQMVAAMIMIIGYSIIAVPTGIVTVEMNRARKKATSLRVCRACSAEGHDEDAVFCKLCGEEL